MKKTFLSKVHAISPAVQIGKAGLTPKIVDEIKRQIKKKGLIKVKMLGSFSKGKKATERKVIARELAEKTDSELVQSVGFVVVLVKKRKKLI